MKLPKFSVAIVSALAFSAAVSQATQVYNFTAVAGASMQFNGTASSFQFNNNGSGNLWWITSEGTGNSVLGFQGQFTGGPWSYGPIAINGSEQDATVNPTATTLSINDGHGDFATADVVWGTIDTVQSGGGINADLTVNLSSLSYSGLNADLASFFSAPAGVLSLSFQFAPAMTLTDLTTGTGPYTTSFSGSLAPTPEPGPVLIAGLGLLVLGFRAVRRSIASRA